MSAVLMGESQQHKSVQLVCARVWICCSRKPGISAVIFIPVVLLLKCRSLDCSWGGRSDLDFPAVPRLQALAFMKNVFQIRNRFLAVLHVFIFLKVISGCISYQDKAHNAVPSCCCFPSAWDLDLVSHHVLVIKAL